MPDLTALAAELQSDPAALGYAAPLAAGDDAAVAALLNAKSYRGPVPIVELSAAALAFGLIGKCEVALYTPATPETLDLCRLCSQTLTLLRDDYRLTTADVDDPDLAAGLDAFVAIGWLTSDQRAYLAGLAAGRASRADLLFGGPITPSHVAAALGRP